MGLYQAWRRLAAPFRHWTLPACITLACVLSELAADAGRIALRFDRTAIAAWEFWRLLTGHFVHLGWSHLVLNVLGLLLVWLLCGVAYPVATWSLIIVVVVAGVDFGLWFLDPGLEWYVGLSGLLHGMLAAGILALVIGGSTEMLLLGLLLAAKLAWEQLQGPLPGSAELAGATVVVDAHLYGAVAGLAVAALVRVGRSRPI